MTKFLLDTNVLLWYFENSNRIETVKELIISGDSEVYFSTVSLWEIAIKIKTGKLKLDIDELRFYAKKYSFYELPVTGVYMNVYLNLPHFHKDPFDHMLLAQAIVSPMRLITGDSLLKEYSSLVMLI